MYKFGFDNCDKIIELSEEEVHRIPYLLTLMLHKDDFLSIKNNKNEYILHYPICYNLLIPILNSINNEKPYSLLNDLSINENIFDVFQLFDYLCLNQSNSLNNQDRRFIYHRAKNLCEVRNIATRFVLSLTRNEHNLNDLRTIEYVFSFISVIFSNKSIFSSQFRYHTYTILEEYVFPLFFKKHPIYLLNDIKQNYTIDSNIYFYDDNQMIPIDFKNDFLWKGYFEHIINKLIKQSHIIIVGATNPGKSSLLSSLFGNHVNEPSRSTYNLSQNIEQTETESFIFLDTPGLLSNESASLTKNSDLYLNESQVARLGYFNTRSKQIQVDKFKHKYKTKVEKYR
ncbi:unnamed protein product [Adineta steineri]|uniref:G domain-containing protein n=1 Tax=Adineta steineri TaxID=433720 RepID=A0A820B629_9BILA|nr:unnamed protein product [Adineta steineri]CAF4187396.1 unnamed protein product [Adineta steineri]